MKSRIKIDGSRGEGGGQVLRTSLALSLVTGQPFEMTRIRAGRKRPGLLRQHLAAVRAAGQIGDADVSEVGMGDSSLVFEPGAVRAGPYRFAVGTAGSATLVLQAVLPALLTADAPSQLVLEGGTHNPFAPPFDFLAEAFLPVVRRMGPDVCAQLERPGFYPAGGGQFTVDVTPSETLAAIELRSRGALVRHTCEARVAGLPEAIARAELDLIGGRLSLGSDQLRVEKVSGSRGPGNVVIARVECENITEIVTGFGERGVSAERVATSVVKGVREYLTASAPVGRYLADQLMIPFALAGAGAYRCLPLTRHARTNIEVIQTFLDVKIDVKDVDKNTVEIEFGAL